jgi:hypothetical protein
MDPPHCLNDVTYKLKSVTAPDGNLASDKAKTGGHDWLSKFSPFFNKDTLEFKWQIDTNKYI